MAGYRPKKGSVGITNRKLAKAFKDPSRSDVSQRRHLFAMMLLFCLLFFELIHEKEHPPCNSNEWNDNDPVVHTGE